MYTPKHFKIEDEQQIYEFLKQNSFGMLISSHDRLSASHLPFSIDQKAKKLYGHMARANQQWKELEGDEVLIIFQGPHAYISPQWYAEENTVPTWNYMAVHIYGKFVIQNNGETVMNQLESMVDTYESGFETPWKVDISSEYNQNLVKHIVGFEIEIKNIQCKFKLNQNHPIERRKNAIHGLRTTNQHESIQIADAMEKSLSDH
ncbi:FMN-binding negative transcriptional regulator [Chengkuizengella axinellae]|uniref:FMN-binding negative transcriptional regulator n=1 Tax=Chengkuizengella axinellae TaxID=3064388 RepID=A0ABT9IW63_9BACL|nr:FMN-binding negative transcriptional regulator [Chengkuizengella sp. 2205SS18-9]MDP5273575.1 FMN-binding negative transcriptional regulator [Chengkuizengella sp. 2205SS18-9]